MATAKTTAKEVLRTLSPKQKKTILLKQIRAALLLTDLQQENKVEWTSNNLTQLTREIWDRTSFELFL